MHANVAAAVAADYQQNDKKVSAVLQKEGFSAKNSYINYIKDAFRKTYNMLIAIFNLNVNVSNLVPGTKIDKKNDPPIIEHKKIESIEVVARKEIPMYLEECMNAVDKLPHVMGVAQKILESTNNILQLQRKLATLITLDLKGKLAASKREFLPVFELNETLQEDCLVLREHVKKLNKMMNDIDKFNMLDAKKKSSIEELLNVAVTLIHTFDILNEAVDVIKKKNIAEAKIQSYGDKLANVQSWFARGQSKREEYEKSVNSISGDIKKQRDIFSNYTGSEATRLATWQKHLEKIESTIKRIQ